MPYPKVGSRDRRAEPGIRNRPAALAFLAVVVGAITLAVVAPPNNAAATFLFELGLLAAAMVFLGLALNDRVLGAAIDSRNRVSLSKLQMIAWSVLVLAALAVLAAYRLRYGTMPDPLDIAIPPELLFAMGIAAGSVVATPTLLSLKAAESPSPESVATATAANNPDDPDAAPTNIGKVDVRARPGQARFTDIFTGDLVGDMLSIDLSKVQQAAFTVLLIGMYIGAVYSSLGTGGLVLPPLGEDFVKLLAISHGGYLLYKAAPRTSTGGSGAGEAGVAHRPAAARPPPVAPLAAPAPAVPPPVAPPAQPG